MKETLFEWFRLVCRRSIRLAFLSGITVILYAGLLHAMNFLWMLYLETPVGKRFMSLHGDDISVIEGLQAESFLRLSFELVLIVVTVCLVFGAMSQVFLLIRLFYEGRGSLFRLTVWGVPSVALTAIAIFRTYDLGLEASFLLGLVPTIVVFQSCLRFTLGLLPDLSTAIAYIVTLARMALKRERRAERRFDIELPLAYSRRRSSTECRSIASQVSYGGFCLRDFQHLASGEIIKFELEVEDDSVHGEARIEWTKSVTEAGRKATRLFASGCRIVSMASNCRSILRAYLRRLSVEET